MEAVRQPKRKVNSRNVAPVTMQELERRLDQLPSHFDELPSTADGATHASDGDKTVDDQSKSKDTTQVIKEDSNTVREDDYETAASSVNDATETGPVAESAGDGVLEQEGNETIASADITGDQVSVPDLSLFPAVEPITELPISAILPHSATSEHCDVVPTPSVYPDIKRECLEDVVDSKSSAMYPRLSSTQVDAVQETVHAPVPRERTMPDAPLFHESVHDVLQQTEGALLSESQLLSYYHNQLYEDADDFVDAFIEMEESSRKSLWEYLERYKDACERMALNEVEVAENERLVKQTAANAWTAQNRIVHKQGKCGDDKHVSGSSSYLVATLHPERVKELAQLLKTDATARLDGSLSLQIETRALALQIQWMVVDINNAFLIDHRLTVTSPPCLIADAPPSPSRIGLRGALSDAFHFLRFPAQSSRFVDGLVGWICEMGAVLMKLSTSQDQQYMLCQLLRVPSPVASWGAPLLQPYTDVGPHNYRLAIDHLVAMISILLSPIRAREKFLKRIVNYEKEDNSWAILSEDVDEGEISLASVSEADLIAFLEQLGTEALFAKAVEHFVTIDRSNAAARVLSLIALELVLLKIFNEGIETYSRTGFKQLCKQIGYALRQSVKCVASLVELAQDVLCSQEKAMVQNELDRIILHAIHYIVTNQSVGLWQFLVDLPYGCVSETCRMRCQMMLRVNEKLTVADLYQISDSELPNRLATGVSLSDRLTQLPADDSNYMLTALTATVSCALDNSDLFITELLNACFLDESTRDQFYKVGSEAIGMLLDKHPQVLTRLLLLIDRNVDIMEDYAVDVLSSAPLAKCRLSVNDVGSICGKWLINRAPDHPGSRIARRVMGSMNWGVDWQGVPWMDSSVHEACAETIIKGHMAQCKNTNGLIAKSINKVAKLASKVPDYEHQFDTFCWDILLRLKLPSLKDSTKPPIDLAAFFVQIVERCMSSMPSFMSQGLSLWTDLVNAGCYAPCCVILTRLVALHPNAMQTLVTNQIFVETVDRLLHADQSSYAVQLIAGSDQFPGPTLKLLGSAIMYELSDAYSEDVVHGWMQLLCCKRPTEWQSDKASLYLLGVLTRTVFETHPDHMDRLSLILQPLYAAIVQQWKESSRGVFGWLSADQSPPSLIASPNLAVSPWASYLLLLTEQRAFDVFYQALYSAMGKHPKHTLEQAVKKAVSKSHTPLDVTRVHYYRWLELCCADGVLKSTVFPLACQQLALSLFARKNYAGSKVCYGDRYSNCLSSTRMFENLRKTILPHVEQDCGKEIALYYKALGQWLSSTEIYDANLTRFDDVLLDHLVQLICAGDTLQWTQFVDKRQLEERRNEGRKLYALTCHIGPMSAGTQPSNQITSISDLVAKLLAQSRTRPMPPLPSHRCLPIKSHIDISLACNRNSILALFKPHLNAVSEAARSFVGAKDNVESLDDMYMKQYPNLYSHKSTELDVVLKCGTMLNKCTHPVTVTATVMLSQHEGGVETQMNENRQKRSSELATAFANLVDSTAVRCAHVQYIAIRIWELRKVVSGLNAQNMQQSGRELFYTTASSLTSLEMLCPASSATYSLVLSKLGEAVIANEACEQMQVMRLVLQDSPVSHWLVPHFTPACIPPSELFSLYTTLSHAVRKPATCHAALSLMARLDIESTGTKLPPHQFSQLMPIAFENVISIADSSSPLYELCTKHFIHSLCHHFPDNFVPGLAVILAACGSSSTPVAVLNELVAVLHADVLDSRDSKPQHVLDPMTACTASSMVREQLAKSRAELGTRLISVWGKYLQPLMVLVEFFLRTQTSGFDSDRAVSILEAELRQQFDKCVEVFAPLMEPFGVGSPPWNPADADAAACVLDSYVAVTSGLHSLYDPYLPPDCDNVESLMLQRYANTLGRLARGSAHVHTVVESRLIRVAWNAYWPNLADMALMNNVLCEGAVESAPLITQIAVRISWSVLVQHQCVQPVEGIRAFCDLLFSILARCVSRPGNYTACRASMPKLLGSLNAVQWNLISVDQLSKTSAFIGASFPENALSDWNDVTSAFFGLHARVCSFSTVPSSKEAQYNKQAVYIRTQMQLMCRNAKNMEWVHMWYKQMISTVNAILISRGDASEEALCMTRELTAFWSTISDTKLGELVSQEYNTWISNNCESALVLQTIRTVVDSLSAIQVSTAVKIVETCIASYFTRTGQCDWMVVSNWLLLPHFAQRLLFTTPSSEKGVNPQWLTLHALIHRQLHECSSMEQETELFNSLLDYMASVKPKFVTNEAAFVLVVDKLLKLTVRQLGFGLERGNMALGRLIEWLLKVHSDEKSSFFSAIRFAKKHQFPVKIRYLCNVLELYLAQQTMSPGQPPRNTPHTPVLNSRIQALKELASSKPYAHLQSTSQLAHPFFTDVDTYHIGHAAQLFDTMVNALYQDNILKSIRYL